MPFYQTTPIRKYVLSPSQYIRCHRWNYTIKCVNCKESHNPAYKGHPLRINMVNTIHERMGLEPQRKTNPQVQKKQTNPSTMDGATTNTGTSMPSTSSLPTTHPNGKENCDQRTKESSTSYTGQISHNNGHCYPGSHESLDENSGHHQGTHQDSTQGAVQQGTG